MEAYSPEFRLSVLAACDAGGNTRMVATQFRVSESWVRRIKQTRREEGRVLPKTTRRRRRSWEPYTPWLLAKFRQQPGLYLRELQALARKELGWKVSAVTLSRARRELLQNRVRSDLVEN